MSGRTSSWLVCCTLWRCGRTLARQAIGLAIFFSGFVVIVVYVLRRLST
jgi:hypothetical protein